MANGRPINPRRWTFVLNNPGGGERTGPDARDESPEGLPATLGEGKGFRFLIFQLEQGANGTPHYQGTSHLTSLLPVLFM